jgi:aspartyl-tRNA synthetase
MTEFVGLDLEMEVKEHYFEVLDVIGNTFYSIFNGLTE